MRTVGQGLAQWGIEGQGVGQGRIRQVQHHRGVQPQGSAGAGLALRRPADGQLTDEHGPPALQQAGQFAQGFEGLAQQVPLQQGRHPPGPSCSSPRRPPASASRARAGARAVAAGGAGGPRPRRPGAPAPGGSADGPAPAG